MKVIDDIISTLNEDAPVKEVRACVFWTAVVSRHCGLASTIRPEGPHHTRNPVADAGFLTAKSALELAQCAHSDSPPEASIGMAAVNSLIDIDLDRCVDKNAFEVLSQKGAGKKVAIIGHFPFVPKLKEIAATLWVLERNPSADDLPEPEAERVLPQADVVGMTGTTLINQSFEHLISFCRHSFVVMLGPSTPLSPVLFDQGVDVISGVKVTDPERVLTRISEGASFRQVEGVRLLTMTRE